MDQKPKRRCKDRQSQSKIPMRVTVMELGHHSSVEFDRHSSLGSQNDTNLVIAVRKQQMSCAAATHSWQRDPSSFSNDAGTSRISCISWLRSRLTGWQLVEHICCWARSVRHFYTSSNELRNSSRAINRLEKKTRETRG